MIFELAGSRMMAPYFGGSIYVWTGIIGVIMGSLALGYWYGGRLADKKSSYEIYSIVIFAGAIAIYWAMFFKDGIPKVIQALGMPIESGALVASLLMFAPASIILGIVSPYAVRLKIVSVESSASTVGNLYALSTVGSIAGTFAAGYFLIPFLGTSKILIALVAVLVILSIALSKKLLKLKIAIALVLIGSAVLTIVTDNKNNASANRVSIETEYNSINIFHSIHKETLKPIINLTFDPYAKQSSMFEDSDELVWDYTKYYRLIKHFSPNAKNTLMIGGGAYSFPKDYLKRFPDAKMDVVEIDPGITDAAKKYFRLKDDPRLANYNEDARAFLNRTKNKYDVILDDAFNSALSVPFQLGTVEAVKRQYDVLGDNGIVIANVIGTVGGDNGRFFRAEYATFKSIFPQVYVFAVKDDKNEAQLQNLMIVAIKSKDKPQMTSADEELNGYLKNLWKQPIAEMPILTDDYAPVEYYMKSII